MLRHPLLPTAAIAAACTCAAHGQTVPPGFAVEILATGLAAPTCAAVASDGRIFIAQQGGRVRIYRDDLGLLPDRFHAFRTIVPIDYDERGLIGIELHPDFESNGHLYAHLSRETPPLGASIMRVTASRTNANVADPATETEIFNIGTYSQLVTHVGGALHFGPDGAIYIGVGSNPGRHTPQSLDSTFGKVLRINPDGSIPADNPFYDATSGNNRAIWALGLRNPFTFAFHPSTGRMFVNDVGNVDWEEINEGFAGANFGWPLTEGDFDPAEFPGLSRPFSTYHHRDGAVAGLAITGGVFYEPPLCSFPVAYVDSYFFADFSGNWVKRLDPSTRTVHDFAADLGLIVDTKVDPQGRLLVLSRSFGRLYRISYVDARGACCNPDSDCAVVHWSKCPDGFRGTGTICDTGACCRANFNADGALNSQDFFDFVAAFFDARAEADFNTNGIIDPQDFVSYLTAFAGGC